MWFRDLLGVIREAVMCGWGPTWRLVLVAVTFVALYKLL